MTSENPKRDNNDTCELCAGHGEIQTLRAIDHAPATAPCPDCIRADLKRERLALLGLIQPFAEAFERERVVHDRTRDNDKPEGMQDFLDRNRIVPTGTVIGHWRKLADEYAVLSHEAHRGTT